MDYCHFDERRLGDMKEFISTAKGRRVNGVAVFGGYGSENAVPVAKYIRNEGLVLLTDKDFTENPPLERIGIVNDKVCFDDRLGNETVFSYEQFVDLFNRK